MADKFIWYELMTTDRDSAIAFYRNVVGWEASDFEPQAGAYTILSAGQRSAGGMMELTDGMCRSGMPPAWLGYIGVADVDSAARSVSEAGGAVLMEARDIPTIGRFALVADPGGAPFYLLTPLPREDLPPPLPRMTPGHVGWHELYAADGDSAFEFYSKQFGWTEASVMDMGPMGTYRLWAAGGEPLGGMMTKTPDTPRPAWNFYFVVDGVESAAGRIAEHGGKVTNGPMEVPDGSWIVMAADPQGAAFALVSEKR